MKTIFSSIVMMGLLLAAPSLRAEDKTETLYIQAPSNGIQPPPSIPTPDFAEPSKADAVEIDVDALKARVDALEKKLETCGCEKTPLK
ncbi:hypothetical protein Bealeia1_01454 [Candidatus Bealeia paramacronuclearis]|uniref:Uncharacterized protein n=1 Tax=Candidatus Bealeia paramacronuclearis TaxID=1921001 RepID=A0ABZ2C522_9PROT|nr:hypothetical protein [Candidatus Bealeia paramacronuclearis]